MHNIIIGIQNNQHPVRSTFIQESRFVTFFFFFFETALYNKPKRPNNQTTQAKPGQEPGKQSYQANEANMTS